MIEKKHTGDNEQQPTPSGYYKHEIGGSGLFLYLSNREGEQAQGHQCQARWYDKISSWIRRGFPVFLRRYGILLVTVLYTYFAGQQWVTMRRQLELSERPWVALDRIDIPHKPTAGSAFFIGVSLRNGGESPALRSNVEGRLHPVVMPRGDERVPLVDMAILPRCAKPKLQWSDKLRWDNKPQWGQDIGGSLILPGAEGISLSLSTQALDENLVRKITNNEGRISPLERKELEGSGSGDLVFMGALPEYEGKGNWDFTVRIFFVGCIDYFDQFQEPHRTSFCLYYSPSLPPDGGFSPCKMGNEAD